MLGSEFTRTTTLSVIKEFVVCSQELYNLLCLKPKRRGLRRRWFERKKNNLEKRLEDRTGALARELAGRYRGLMVQIFERAGVAEQDYDGQVYTIWESVEDRVLALRDYRDFPACFWRAIAAEVGEEGISSLKPKFMIRPFVDELQPSPERNALLTRAYGMPGRPPSDEDFEVLLEPACSLLHSRLTQRSEHLHVLTDEVLTSSRLAHISPFEQYTTWLFRA